MRRVVLVVTIGAFALGSSGCGLLLVAVKDQQRKQRQEKKEQQTIEKRRDQIRAVDDDELLADYNRLVEIEDETNERQEEGKYEQLGDAFSCVKDYLSSLEDEQDEADLEENLDNFGDCRETCKELAEKGSRNYHEIAGKYRSKCDEKHQAFAETKRIQLKEKYRKSMQAYAEAIPESEWPMTAYRRFQKLRLLTSSVEREWGEDDELVQKYKGELDEVKEGKAGPKIEKFDAFLKREEITRLNDKLQAARSDVSRYKQDVRRAQSDLDHARSPQDAEWARGDLRKAEANLRDARARVRETRSRLSREAIDADLCPADADYRYNVAVRPGDRPAGH